VIVSLYLVESGARRPLGLGRNFSAGLGRVLATSLAVVLVVGLAPVARGDADAQTGRADAAVESSSPPWWDDYPTILRTGDAEAAATAHATGVICGIADDPCWGIYGQRLRMLSSADNARRICDAGLKAITWIEAYGTTHCYIAQVKKNPDGSWVKLDGDPATTQVFWQHWGWHGYDGTGLIRWVGSKNWFDDEDFARPYTRTHPRYGGPPMKYPDGTVASGYFGAESDPRTSRVYDAGCAKDVLGRVSWGYGFNRKVNEIDPATGNPKGPITGLLEVGDKYAGMMLPGKDAVCPAWIHYTRASITQALDAGVDGVWADNFSAFDSFSQRPVTKAFGEWSVAIFRKHLREHFTPESLEALGITDLDAFDVRAYLRDKCRAWGGTPENFFDPCWGDERWRDDAVWRAYLIHRRRTGTAALEAFYRTIKKAAAANGKPDFLVSGNDIPTLSLGWVRGELDMVSVELGWGWGLVSGKRGFMPPPRGSYVPFYKAAREHARSRFVNVWMYVPQDQVKKPNIASVLYYQGLANHTLPAPTLGHGHTAGTVAADTAFFEFVERARPVFGGRRPVEEIGVYFSSSSHLMSLLPGGIREFNNQGHLFAHWGWGVALSWLHCQYRAVPEWKLTRETLSALRLLIIPNSEVFPPEDVAVLADWVREGGRLILTGETGTRAGESQNFNRLPEPSIAPLTGIVDYGSAPPEKHRSLGQGVVVYLKEPLGLEFFKADRERPGMLGSFGKLTDSAGERRPFVLRDMRDVPPTVGLTIYADEKAGRFFVDVNNTDIDLVEDRITPSPPLTFTVRPPEWLRGKRLHTRTLSPDGDVHAKALPTGEGDVLVTLPAIRLYVSVVMSAADRG